MGFLRHLPIRRKLTIIVIATTSLALLLVCVAFAGYELVQFRGRMAAAVASAARIVGHASASALAFDDPESARDTLTALRALPHVNGAAVYDQAGRTFASYSRDGAAAWAAPEAASADGFRFESDRLRLFQAIDLAGERAGTVFIELDLEELADLRRRYAVTVLLLMIAGSLVAWGVSARLQSAVSGPIAHLAAVVAMVTEQGNYAVRARKSGDDELGQLIDGFNGMLGQIQARDSALEEARSGLERRVRERTEELEREIVERRQAQTALEDLHRQLLDTSRRAGMAEIATNVLHNVGNVLTSVNVSANLVGDTVGRLPGVSLGRLVGLLDEHAADLGAFFGADPRGRHIPAFLAQVAKQLVRDQEQIGAEVDSLRKNIDHIKDIVAMQQDYAKVSGVKETLPVSELVEDSLRMNGGALLRHGVEVERQYEDLPQLTLEKHKVVQILVNLVRNAKYACDESGRADKRVTVRLFQSDGCVRIAVSDNGVGIAAENMSRIFNHGFTTRDGGHGFGLHSGALAARELGGTLEVSSAGIGHGATFTLCLPLAAAELPPVDVSVQEHLHV